MKKKQENLSSCNPSFTVNFYYFVLSFLLLILSLYCSLQCLQYKRKTKNILLLKIRERGRDGDREKGEREIVERSRERK